MYNTLSEIKTQLFDAPIDVKEAFNKVAEYFDKGPFSLVIYEDKKGVLAGRIALIYKVEGTIGDMSDFDDYKTPDSKLILQKSNLTIDGLKSILMKYKGTIDHILLDFLNSDVNKIVNLIKQL